MGQDSGTGAALTWMAFDAAGVEVWQFLMSLPRLMYRNPINYFWNEWGGAHFLS